MRSWRSKKKSTHCWGTRTTTRTRRATSDPRGDRGGRRERRDRGGRGGGDRAHGSNDRTLEEGARGDRRSSSGPQTTPAHALTEEERKQMVALATSPEY